MSASSRLRAADYRALTHLSHECRDLGDEPVLWRTHLAEGLAPLTGSGFVMVVGEECLAGDGSSYARHSEWGWENGFDKASVQALLAKLDRSPFYNPMYGPYLTAMARENGVCRSRPELVSDGEWYRSAYYDEHRAARAGAILFCFRQTGGKLSGLVHIRPARSPDFSARAKAIVREAHALIAPLIGGPLSRFSELTPAGLPPRVRQALRCLLEGDSDKQIAARLGLSPFTVNEYTKRAYRHFGVSGRAELMAAFLRRFRDRRQ